MCGMILFSYTSTWIKHINNNKNDNNNKLTSPCACTTGTRKWKNVTMRKVIMRKSENATMRNVTMRKCNNAKSGNTTMRKCNKVKTRTLSTLFDSSCFYMFAYLGEEAKIRQGVNQPLYFCVSNWCKWISFIA
jgi:hypothetical protein